MGKPGKVSFPTARFTYEQKRIAVLSDFCQIII
jgi:hypothetical protein